MSKWPETLQMSFKTTSLALDFPPDANVSEIATSSIALILDQTDTRYILQMRNDLLNSMLKPLLFLLSFEHRMRGQANYIRAQNAWTSQLQPSAYSDISKSQSVWDLFIGHLLQKLTILRIQASNLRLRFNPTLNVLWGYVDSDWACRVCRTALSQI